VVPQRRVGCSDCVVRGVTRHADPTVRHRNVALQVVRRTLDRPRCEVLIPLPLSWSSSSRRASTLWRADRKGAEGHDPPLEMRRAPCAFPRCVECNRHAASRVPLRNLPSAFGAAAITTKWNREPQEGPSLGHQDESRSAAASDMWHLDEEGCMRPGAPAPAEIHGFQRDFAQTQRT
jgi:hypothetical protein